MEYLKQIKNENSKEILTQQIENFEKFRSVNIKRKHYKIGQDILLKKGTLIHGTYKNLEGLKEIVKKGLISSSFINERLSKYPGCVSVWNLKEDMLLGKYIDFYSGGTIKYRTNEKETTKVISFSEMKNILKYITDLEDMTIWYLEQTKEARFLPSLVQNAVQIGIVFNGENKEIKELLEYDVLSENIEDEEVREFVNKDYYNQFIIDRKNKNDLFTDRESAVVFGIPSNFIEGILVGKIYEQNKEILKEIKSLLPDCYIANLDGKVIF